MRRIKLTLEYDGSNFFGWQLQSATGKRTVQGVVQAALAALPEAVPRVHAAGRTDAGVHALAMVAHCDIGGTLEPRTLQRALNARLPADVRVLAAEEVASDFEAQFSCCWRRYLYRIKLARHDLRGAALERRRALFVYRHLDVTAMQEACGHFSGRQDFAALATQETRESVREVFLCRLDERGRELTLHVAADGFLRGMVRAMVGTLLWVGSGKLKPQAVADILASKDRKRAGPNAPPHGLYFAEAGYTPWNEANGTRAEGAL